MVAAALSPLLVLVLVAAYGWLARSLRVAFLHACLQAIWVIWFWSASNLNEATLLGVSTDHVIWAAFALYVLHALLLLILVLVHASRRLRSIGQATAQRPTAPGSAVSSE
jgi:hypothetical protein